MSKRNTRKCCLCSAVIELDEHDVRNTYEDDAVLCDCCLEELDGDMAHGSVIWRRHRPRNRDRGRHEGGQS